MLGVARLSLWFGELKNLYYYWTVIEKESKQVVLLSAEHQNRFIYILYSSSFKLVRVTGQLGPRRGIWHWTHFFDLAPYQIPKSKSAESPSSQYNQQGLIQLLKRSYLVPFETENFPAASCWSRRAVFPMCLRSRLPHLCTSFGQLNWASSMDGCWTLRMHWVDWQPSIFTECLLTAVGAWTLNMHVDAWRRAFSSHAECYPMWLKWCLGAQSVAHTKHLVPLETLEASMISAWLEQRWHRTCNICMPFWRGSWVQSSKTRLSQWQ